MLATIFLGEKISTKRYWTGPSPNCTKTTTQRVWVRSNPDAKYRLAALKHACEQAKIDLSRAETAEVIADLGEDDSGNPIELELTIDRAQFDALTLHLTSRTLAVCERLVKKNRLSADAIERVVFVGGPTLIPSVRESIDVAYGGRGDTSRDPMTLVAQGAALYAATLGIEANRVQVDVTEGAVPIRLEHPAVTSDRTPYVVGRLLGDENDRWPKMLVVSTDAPERRDRVDLPDIDVDLSDKGDFAFQVSLEPSEQTRFRIQGIAADGSPIAVVPGSFAIVHGLSIAEPPLSRSVGIARSDDTVQEYFKKGTPLPARRTFTHKTTTQVSAGSSEEALAVPVVQGEFSRAHRNRLIGVLKLRGSELERDLPLGSRLEVTLELDTSGQLHARAEATAIGQVFADVVHVLVPTASLEVLEQTLTSTSERVGEIRRRGLQVGSFEAYEAMGSAESRLREAEAGMVAARGGDADAAQRVLRLLLDLNGELDSTDSQLAWPELEEELAQAIETSLAWVSELGSKAEKLLHQRAMEAAERARESQNAPELDRQIKVLRSLTNAAFAKDPEAPVYSFEWYLSHLSEATDLRKAHHLADQGRTALTQGDKEALKTINRQLDELFPGTAEERRKSYGSGVQ